MLKSSRDPATEVVAKTLSTGVFTVRQMMELRNEKTAVAIYYSNFHSRKSDSIIIIITSTTIKEMPGEMPSKIL